MNRKSAPQWAGVVLCFFLAAGVTGGKNIMKTEILASQPCWVIENGTVRLAITRIGAHMAPVTFGLDSDRTIRALLRQPLAGRGPQARSARAGAPARRFLLPALRREQRPYEGMIFPPHGEPAGSPWTIVGSNKAGARYHPDPRPADQGPGGQDHEDHPPGRRPECDLQPGAARGLFAEDLDGPPRHPGRARKGRLAADRHQQVPVRHDLALPFQRPRSIASISRLPSASGSTA